MCLCSERHSLPRSRDRVWPNRHGREQNDCSTWLESAVCSKGFAFFPRRTYYFFSRKPTFLEGFSSRTGPLTEFLKKDHKWEWNGPQNLRLGDLKKAMMEGPVLGIADVSKASGNRRIWFCLSPPRRPSHCLWEQETEGWMRRGEAGEKEMLAVVH